MTDPKEIVNEMNNYFSNVGVNLAKTLKHSKSTFDTYMPPDQINSMFCPEIKCNEILIEINKLNPRKSSGPDNIGPSLLIEFATSFVKPLFYLYNLSISTGIMPSKLKIAKVIPIYKKSETTDPSNYRPISLLSIFNKLLEKLVCRRLVNFLDKCGTIYEYQFGFRKKHSTSLALIEVVDSIYKHLDNHDYVVGIYIDLQKAFDTVDHNILLAKMYKYGIRGTMHKWFQSYLCDRKQYTCVSNSSSCLADVKCGVPQGSVLEPILFYYISMIYTILLLIP